MKNQSLVVMKIICTLQIKKVILPLNRLLINVVAIPNYLYHELYPFNTKSEYILQIEL